MDLKVLIVENTETEAKLVVRELLRQGFSVSWQRVDTERALRGALRADRWDLVISSASVPSLGALGALASTQAVQPGVPVIVVSATVSEEEAVEVMRAGAADFVTTGKLSRLGAAAARELREPRPRRPSQRIASRLLAAQEAERRRVARALHDELGQGLTALQLTLRTALEAEGPANKRAISEALSLAIQVSEQTRAFSHDLCPVMLDDLGLLAALRCLTDRHKKWSGITIDLDVGPIGRFDPSVEIAAFRLVQEALTNVARHAEARSVRVAVEEVGGELRLEVRDDGGGFDVESALARSVAGESLGLAGMRERVSLASGTFDIQSAPGRGTIVRAVFPVPSEGAR